MAEVRRVREGTHYTVGEAGPLEELDAKLFVGKPLGFTGMEVSLNRVAPGQGVPFLHRHRLHEEMYLFLRGEGEFQVDDDLFPVHAGSVVRVEPDAVRGWHNTGDEDLYCIVIQANVGSLTGQDGIRLEDEPGWTARG